MSDITKKYPEMFEQCFDFSPQKGWEKLINELTEKIHEIDPEVKVLQVKEKFGGLRYYISSGTDEVFDLIEEAEEKSYSICQETGKPGKLRDDIGWIRTLCDEEYEKVKEERAILIEKYKKKYEEKDIDEDRKSYLSDKPFTD